MTMPDLRDLLTQLQAGTIQVIEFGDPNQQPGSYFSYLRVRWTPTAGGAQFRVCELYSGREGSGMYYPDVDSALEQCERLVERYLRPRSNVRAVLMAWRKGSLGAGELGWFSFQEADKLTPPPLNPDGTDPLFEGEHVITLTATFDSNQPE